MKREQKQDESMCPYTKRNARGTFKFMQKERYIQTNVNRERGNLLFLRSHGVTFFCASYFYFTLDRYSFMFRCCFSPYLASQFKFSHYNLNFFSCIFICYFPQKHGIMLQNSMKHENKWTATNVKIILVVLLFWAWLHPLSSHISHAYVEIHYKHNIRVQHWCCGRCLWVSLQPASVLLQRGYR